MLLIRMRLRFVCKCWFVCSFCSLVSTNSYCFGHGKYNIFICATGKITFSKYTHLMAFSCMAKLPLLHLIFNQQGTHHIKWNAFAQPTIYTNWMKKKNEPSCVHWLELTHITHTPHERKRTEERVGNKKRVERKRTAIETQLQYKNTNEFVK